MRRPTRAAPRWWPSARAARSTSTTRRRRSACSARPGPTATRWSASRCATPTRAVQRVEYSLDADRWRPIYPKDGIADSRLEEFELTIETDTADKAIILRAVDAMNNVATGRAEPRRRAEAVIRPRSASRRGSGSSLTGRAGGRTGGATRGRGARASRARRRRPCRAPSCAPPARPGSRPLAPRRHAPVRTAPARPRRAARESRDLPPAARVVSGVSSSRLRTRPSRVTTAASANTASSRSITPESTSASGFDRGSSMRPSTDTGLRSEPGEAIAPIAGGHRQRLLAQRQRHATPRPRTESTTVAAVAPAAAQTRCRSSNSPCNLLRPGGLPLGVQPRQHVALDPPALLGHPRRHAGAQQRAHVRQPHADRARHAGQPRRCACTATCASMASSPS